MTQFYQGLTQPAGVVRLAVKHNQSLTAMPDRELPAWELLKYGLPRTGLPREVFNWRYHNLPHCFAACGGCCWRNLCACHTFMGGYHW